ncbi:MAG: gas vesicle protein GvpG [Bacillota bacterium]
MSKVLIIDDILFAPFKGLWWLAREIYNRAQQELFDEETIQKQLAALQVEYELGNLPRDEFEQQEAMLLDRLRQARAARTLQSPEEEED